MAFHTLENKQTEIATSRLIRDLTTAVPGELGRMLRAIVGVASEAASGAVHINPAAGPIRWSSSLLELCCRIYGSPVERAIPVGASLALLGIASSALDASQDGHEDLLVAYNAGCEDSSTGGGAYSNCVALTANASTAIIGLAWRALLEYGPHYGIEVPTLLEIGQLIADRLVSICGAQHRDLTQGRTADISLEDYDQIIAGKTGQIDGTACEVGALLAGASRYRDLWRSLGAERAIAEQLYDDYRDFSDDLLNGRQISHPVLYGLAVADSVQKETIQSLLEVARSGGPGARAAVEELTSLLRECGAEFYTLTAMILHRNRALAALDGLHLPPDARTQLQDWVMRVAPAVT